MASITCGHCKASHDSVAAVRACYTGTATATVSVATTLGAEKPAYTAPTPSPTQELVEGRYALNVGGKLHFYRVSIPTGGRWKGYTFVSEQAGDDLYPVRNRTSRETIINGIRQAGVKASAILYGTELGHCGICGRTLTDEASRAAGIGPICASRLGW